MVLPTDVALRLDELPAQIEAGVAVTAVGAAGKAFTVNVPILVAVVLPTTCIVPVDPTPTVAVI